MNMKSIRAKLSVFLLLAALFTALVIGVITYRRALLESERLFDFQLSQIAQSLRDQGEAPNPALRFGADDSALDLVVQIWSKDGEVVYLSNPANPLFDRATLGFADVDTAAGRWRVYSMAARDRIIQVAQPLELKRGRAAAAALQSLVPLLAFAPLMALLIWWRMSPWCCRRIRRVCEFWRAICSTTRFGIRRMAARFAPAWRRVQAMLC